MERQSQQEQEEEWTTISLKNEIGNLNKYNFDMSNRVYGVNGVMPTIRAIGELGNIMDESKSDSKLENKSKSS